MNEAQLLPLPWWKHNRERDLEKANSNIWDDGCLYTLEACLLISCDSFDSMTLLLYKLRIYISQAEGKLLEYDNQGSKMGWIRIHLTPSSLPTSPNCPQWDSFLLEKRDIKQEEKEKMCAGLCPWWFSIIIVQKDLRIDPIEDRETVRRWRQLFVFWTAAVWRKVWEWWTNLSHNP